MQDTHGPTNFQDQGSLCGSSRLGTVATCPKSVFVAGSHRDSSFCSVFVPLKTVVLELEFFLMPWKRGNNSETELLLLAFFGFRVAKEWRRVGE